MIDIIITIHLQAYTIHTRSDISAGFHEHRDDPLRILGKQIGQAKREAAKLKTQETT